MVIKRQKLFFAPVAALGTLAMGGLTVGQMVQSANQAEEAEEQNRQQIKAMNRIAKAAKENPLAAEQFLATKQASRIEGVGSIFSQKLFAGVNSQTMKNIGGFMKDMGTFAWGKRKHIVSGLAMGAGMAATGAVVDKAIQKDIKRNNLPFLEKEQPIQQQYSDINWGEKAQEYATKGQDITKRGVKSLGRELKNTFDFSIKRTVGENGKKKLLPKLGSGYMTAGFAALPAFSYMAEKKQYQDQIKATQSGQKQFSKLPNGSVLKNIGNWFKDNYGKTKEFLTNKPVEKTLNGISGFINNGQNGKQMAQEISTIGKKSGNKYTQQVGKFLENHGKTAAVGAIGVGGAVMSTGWGQGEKLTKKAIKSVDPNAYAYQESKEQVPQ